MTILNRRQLTQAGCIGMAGIYFITSVAVNACPKCEDIDSAPGGGNYVLTAGSAGPATSTTISGAGYLLVQSFADSMGDERIQQPGPPQQHAAKTV